MIKFESSSRRNLNDIISDKQKDIDTKIRIGIESKKRSREQYEKKMVEIQKIIESRIPIIEVVSTMRSDASFAAQYAKNNNIYPSKIYNNSIYKPFLSVWILHKREYSDRQEIPVTKTYFGTGGGSAEYQTTRTEISDYVDTLALSVSGQLLHVIFDTTNQHMDNFILGISKLSEASDDRLISTLQMPEDGYGADESTINGWREHLADTILANYSRGAEFIDKL